MEGDTEDPSAEYADQVYDFIRKATSSLHESDSQSRGWRCCFGLFRRKKNKERLYDVDANPDQGQALLHGESPDMARVFSSSSMNSAGMEDRHIRRLSKINGKDASVNRSNSRVSNRKMVKLLNKRSAQAVRNISLSNKDEWYRYLVRQLTNIEDEIGSRKWASEVLGYLKSNKYALETSKYKGEIFYFQYTRNQKQHLAQIQLI